MRFYTITITDPNGAPPIVWSSLDSAGNFNPGALQVEFDMPVAPAGGPLSNAMLRVWGTGLQYIEQASSLSGRFLSIQGGMSKGLPLARQQEAGLLVDGTIYQAFGTWEGTNQYLDFVILAFEGSKKDPKNLVINWKAGTAIGPALSLALITGFPTTTADVSGISPALVLASDQVGYYQTLPQLASWVKQITSAIKVETASGYPYNGVDIILRGNTFIAFDNSGSIPSAPRQLFLSDLIGQPVWTNSITLQVNVVLRGDLSVGDYIQLPPVLTSSEPQSFPQFRQSPVFQGVGLVTALRHIGNFRQADAKAWVTIIDFQVVNP